MAPTMRGQLRSRSSAGAGGITEIWSAGSKHHSAALKTRLPASDFWTGSSPPSNHDVSGRPRHHSRAAARPPPQPPPRPPGPATARQRPAQPGTPHHQTARARPKLSRPTGVPRHRRLWGLTDPVGLLGSGGVAEVESLEVGGPGPVEWFAGPPGVEPDEVDGGCGGVVLEADFGQAEVAGVADAGDVGGLVYGAHDSCS